MPTTELVYSGQLRCEASHLASKNKIITDAPIDNHGKGETFSPTDLVAAALGACMLTVMGIHAQKENLVLDNSRATVNKVMGSGPRRIVELEVHIYFPSSLNLDDTSRSKLEKVALNCPVAKSLSADLQQKVEFHYA